MARIVWALLRHGTTFEPQATANSIPRPTGFR
jgi:hypothetical protein